jgi:hypothetical protein
VQAVLAVVAIRAIVAGSYDPYLEPLLVLQHRHGTTRTWTQQISFSLKKNVEGVQATLLLDKMRKISIELQCISVNHRHVDNQTINHLRIKIAIDSLICDPSKLILPCVPGIESLLGILQDESAAVLLSDN